MTRTAVHKSKSLRRQIIKIVFLAMAAIILFQVYAIFAILRDNEQRQREAAEAAAVSIAASLDVVGHNIVGLGRFLSSHEAFQRLFIERQYHMDNPAAYVAAAFHTIGNMSYHFPMVRDVVVVPTVGVPLSFYFSRDYQLEQVLETILATYDFSDPYLLTSKFLYFEDMDYFAYITPISNIVTPEAMRRRYATCIIIADKGFITALIEWDARYHFMRYGVFDSAQRLIATSAGNQIFEDEIYFISVEARTMGLTVRAYDVLTVTEGAVALIISFLVFSMIILLIVMLLVFLQLNKKIALPISELVQEMGTWEGTPLKNRLKTSQIHEVDQLVEGFNRLLNEIETNTRKIFATQEKLYEMEVHKNETEIYALQSQMNPHFLFNTLQCIRGIALMEKVDSIAEITLSMSEMLRYAMHYQEEVSIREEVDIIRHYELICRIRFQEKFRFIFDLDENMLDYSIGRMTLQPLVENAVIHGVSKLEEGGVIRIAGGVDEAKEQIWIQIEDNGPGIEAVRLEQIETELKLSFAESLDSGKSHSYGLYNINRRLKLLYGDAFHLDIRSSVVGSHTYGTSVDIRFPACPHTAVNDIKSSSEYFTKTHEHLN